MTLEEMTLMPDPQMPTAAARPSLEDLFRQGNVQVTPGAVGPESARTTGNVPLTPLAAGYQGLADMYRAGAEDLPSGEPHSLLFFEKLREITEPIQQRLDAERMAQQKMEHEAGEPARKAQAAIKEASGKQPFELEQIKARGQAQTAVDVARVQAEHQARLEQLENTRFTNPLFLGKSPKDIAAMNPEQWKAYAATIVGSTKIKDLGQFIQALLTGAGMKPGTFTDSDIKFMIAKQMAVMNNESIDNYLTKSVDSKGNVVYNLKMDYGLTPTAAGVRVQPGETQMTPSVSVKEPQSLTPSISAIPGALEQGTPFDLSQIGLAP